MGSQSYLDSQLPKILSFTPVLNWYLKLELLMSYIYKY